MLILGCVGDLVGILQGWTVLLNLDNMQVAGRQSRVAGPKDRSPHNT